MLVCLIFLIIYVDVVTFMCFCLSFKDELGEIFDKKKSLYSKYAARRSIADGQLDALVNMQASKNVDFIIDDSVSTNI